MKIGPFKQLAAVLMMGGFLGIAPGGAHPIDPRPCNLDACGNYYWEERCCAYEACRATNWGWPWGDGSTCWIEDEICPNM